jgi:CelD/BcsL family acetyltransferase involved in cellulose biosynthesis
MSVQLPAAGSAPEVFRFQHEVRTITDLDAFKAMRLEWNELVATAHDYSFCLTYPYCELAAGLALAAGGVVNVVLVYDERGLRALWPLAIYRHGVLRIAKALSCGAGEEYGGPLLRGEPGGEASCELVTEALRAAMQIHADVLQICFVRGDGALHKAIGPFPQSWLLPIVPKRLRGLPGYSIRLRDYAQWDDFAGTLSKSLCAELRRHFKRLSAKGPTELDWCKTAEDAEAVLRWLFANKRRWALSHRVHTKYLMDNQVRDFFIELARRTDLLTTPLVTFVKVDGVPVAASVNLVGPRSFEGFIMTYDEAFGACSPGSLLQEFCVKWSHANGRDFDFRPVYSAYKARWANHETFHSTQTVFLTLRGRLAEFALLAACVTRLMRKLCVATADVLEPAARLAPQGSTPDGSRLRLPLKGAKTSEPGSMR